MWRLKHRFFQLMEIINSGGISLLVPDYGAQRREAELRKQKLAHEGNNVDKTLLALNTGGLSLLYSPPKNQNDQ